MGLNRREAARLKHLKTWHSSGMTQRAYCQANAINSKTFSNWKRQLRVHFPDLPPRTNSIILAAATTPLIAVKITEDEAVASTIPSKTLLHSPRHAPEGHKISAGTGIRLSVGDKCQILVDRDFDSVTLKRLLTVLSES